MTWTRELRRVCWLLAFAGGAVGCAREMPSGTEQFAPLSSLVVHATVAPSTVAASAELTLTLDARNAGALPIETPGPCPTQPLRLQVVGADSVRRYARVGLGPGCKPPNAVTFLRMPPGWTTAYAARGPASSLLPPGTGAGRYRLRAVFAAPTDTAFGEWLTLELFP